MDNIKLPSSAPVLLALPAGHKRLLDTFVRLDRLMCFSKRNKMTPSVRNLKSLIMSVSKDMGATFNEADFVNDIYALVSLCPDLFELRHPTATDSDPHRASSHSHGVCISDGNCDIDADILVYKKSKGFGSGSISARYKIVFDAILSTVMRKHDEFLRSIAPAASTVCHSAAFIYRKKRSREEVGSPGRECRKKTTLHKLNIDTNKTGGDCWDYSQQGWHPDFPLDTLTLPSFMGCQNQNIDRDVDKNIDRDVGSLRVRGPASGVHPLPKSVQAMVDMMHWYCGQIIHCKTYPAHDPVYEDLEEGLLSERVAAAAETCLRVTPHFYRHQAVGLRAALLGHDVVVATPTASGKSCIFLLPIFQSIFCVVNTPISPCIELIPTALLVFPTKALGNDQMLSIRSLFHELGLSNESLSLSVGALDGDSCASSRETLRRTGVVLTSNPDMLHASVLPQHAKWKRFLSNLKYIVIDEAHVYTGVFGSNVGLVFRRLLRICNSYGSCPQIIAASATMSNPVGHISSLLPLQTLRTLHGSVPGRELVLIDESLDGSHRAARQILLWNPSMIFRGSDAYEGAKIEEIDNIVAVEEFSPANKASHYVAFRRDSIGEISRILAVFMAAGRRTIAFAKSRKSAEYILERVRAAIVELGLPLHLQSLVASYRGGYEKSDRRDIEMRLQRGDLLAVVATNALELGIDVGGLDATLHLGVPQSLASLRQQIGRCGRAGNECISIIVCTNSPTDQFVARQPESIFAQKYDFSCLNFDEPTILTRHLLCAAAESPISPTDPFEAGLWGDTLSSCLDHLVRSREMLEQPQGYVLDAAAALSLNRAKCSLRETDEESFKIIDESAKCVIDNIGFSRIFFEVFEGAIYLNQGRLYRVRCLDFKLKMALLEPLSKMPNYVVKINESTDIKTHSVRYSRALKESSMPEDQIQASTAFSAPASIYFGKVDVVKTAWRLCKVERISGRVIGEQDLQIPPLVYSTNAVWIGVTSRIIARLRELVLHFDQAGAAHAAYHALAAAAEVVVCCSPRDIECPHNIDPSKSLTELVLFDGKAGGTGVCRQIYSHMDDIICTAIKILEGCSCRSLLVCANQSVEAEGCLECVLRLRCPAGNRGMHRSHGLCLLKCLAGMIE